VLVRAKKNNNRRLVGAYCVSCPTDVDQAKAPIPLRTRVDDRRHVPDFQSRPVI